MWNEITSKNNNELLVGYLQEEPDCERLLAVLSWDRNEQSNDNVCIYCLTAIYVNRNCGGFVISCPNRCFNVSDVCSKYCSTLPHHQWKLTVPQPNEWDNS